MIDKDKLNAWAGNIARTSDERSYLYGIVGELSVHTDRIKKLEKLVQELIRQVQELMANQVGTGPDTVTKPKKTTKKTASKGGE